MRYSGIGYYTLGWTYPRSKLREAYPQKPKPFPIMLLPYVKSLIPTQVITLTAPNRIIKPFVVSRK